jgi:mono/diheme cytochrome c family protein
LTADSGGRRTDLKEQTMNRIALGICCALTASFYFWPSAVCASQGQRDLASETRFIFSAKCAGCHGPNLSNPKGRFGYVLDLARVAANREMVVPSFPDESELWELVGRGEMPPEDSPTGPLSAEEKGVIRAWIAAGAPANPQGTTSAARTVGKGILRWLGPFHLLAVHFPIALLISAALMELWRALRGSPIPLPSVRSCVLLGAASAVITAALGWIYADSGSGAGAPRLLGLHRWLGTTAAVWAIGTACFSAWAD